MVDDSVELVRLRNNFYRDNYRRVVGGLLLMVVINLLLGVMIFYQIANRPAPQYFATSTDGRITPLYPLSEPMVAPNELLQWANRAAVAAYTYNFVNWRDALQNVQSNFTPDGWKYFEGALKASMTLETITAKKLVASAVATGAPVILDQGVINGRYAWKVQMPLLVTYQSSTEQIQQALVITMIISRVPTVDVPRGVAIVSFVSATGQSPS